MKVILKPSPFVVKFAGKLPAGKALDLGCGQGRNALFLAKKGFFVDAVDKKEASLDVLKKNTGNLSVKIFFKNIIHFPIKKAKYDLIIAMNSLNVISKKEFELVAGKIKKGLKKDGVCIISMHNTKDPLYQKIKEECASGDGQDFWNEKGEKWYFPKPGGLEEFFRDFKILFYKQMEIKEKGHPGKPEPHSHSLERMVIKK